MDAAREMYTRLLERTDPSDPVVAEEIKKGIRHEYGITDVHDHLPFFRKQAHGNILEIGVRHGASTSAFLSGVEDNGGHVYSVDTEDCSLFAGHPQWTFLHLNSVKDAIRIKELVPNVLDLLFVDGDHSYDSVFSDLCNYGPRAKQIFAHDTEQRDVRAAIDAYSALPDCAQSSFRHDFKSHGLAVLW